MINPAVSTKLVLRVSRQNERFPSTLASDAAGAPRHQGSIGRAKKLAAYQKVWLVAPLVMASARVLSMTALFSPGLLRGIGKNRLCEMYVFGIQHSQIVLPMIHMDFVPRITQKLGDLVFLFIMKF
jgi:hypothetical protein